MTVQAQVLRLLREIRDVSGASILFITHDLGIVAELCDWVYVMRNGQVVEDGSVDQIFSAPARRLHPLADRDEPEHPCRAPGRPLPMEPGSVAEGLIEISGLAKSFGAPLDLRPRQGRAVRSAM